jgi:hypothetical protein
MTELDDRLKAYLDREESERALGKTNEAILHAVARISDALTEHKGENVAEFAKVHGRLDVHDFRIGSVEAVAAKVTAKAESLAEDTGNHRIVIAEKRAGRWDDLAWKVLAMVLVGLLSAGVVEFIHRTAGH